ncbi:Flavohemoprotein [Candida viswanathii]|uniref:nitric oxide dioxygenase n=1 Tax=Candida viswanathii TaxID=5486 RepID=A0A367YJZ5_9ASCO|nr:Flavohemoprotein [Candida viswanathii]
MSETYQLRPLTPDQLDLIAQCVPILEDLNTKLGSKFYKRAMRRYPYLTPYFNETHHKLLRQPRAFVHALTQFAKHIHDMTPLRDVLDRIVHKHVGLQVRPEHYPLLAGVLLETMTDMFPPELTSRPDFLPTWTTVYGNLAAVLINAEEKEYATKAWFGFKEFRVTRVQEECKETKSVYITPVDGVPILKPLRGQYLCMRWMLPGAKVEKSRVYSILEYPRGNEYRVTVRRIPGGQVSGYIHDQLGVGDLVYSGPPCGCVCYKSGTADLVVLAGGNGISALMPVIEAGLEECRHVTLMYSNRSVETRSFLELLKEYKRDYGDQFRVIEYMSRGRYTDPIDEFCNRSLTLEDLEFITPDHDVYLIGPRGYMKMIDDYLRAREVKPALDYFGPQEVTV